MIETKKIISPLGGRKRIWIVRKYYRIIFLIKEFPWECKKIFFKIQLLRKILKHYTAPWDVQDAMKFFLFELFVIFFETYDRPTQYGAETKEESDKIHKDFGEMYYWITVKRDKLQDEYENVSNIHYKQYPIGFVDCDDHKGYSEMVHIPEYGLPKDEKEKMRKKREKEWNAIYKIEKEIETTDEKILKLIIKYRRRLWD